MTYKTLCRGIPVVLAGTILGIIPLVGCGGGGAAMAPVSGTVKVDGQPKPDLIVSFMPSGDAKGSSGKTDAQGRFTLKTIESEGRQGAAVGSHKVMIRPFTQVGAEDEPSSNQPKIELPPKATDGSLTFEVPAGGTDEANFEL